MHNALHEVLPRKARLVTYIVVAVILAALTAYKAADGDLLEASLTLLGVIAPALAASNITPKDATPPPVDYIPEHRADG